MGCPAQHHVRRRNRPSRHPCITPSRCLRRRPQLAVQLVCHRQPIAPSALPLACSWHSAGASVSQMSLHCELQLTSVLAEVAWPASSKTGSKLDSQHHIPCHRLHQSSEHCCSLLCFRHPGPSVRPKISTCQGSASSSQSFTSLRTWSTSSAVCSGGLLPAHRPFPHWVPTQLSSFDKQVLSQIISECVAVAKQPPSTQSEVVTAAYQPDQSVHHLLVSNTDAEFTQRHSHRIHHIQALVGRMMSPHVALSNLQTLPQMVTKTTRASRERRCAREMSNINNTSPSPSTCDLGLVIIKLSCNRSASFGGVAANVAAQSSTSIVDG